MSLKKNLVFGGLFLCLVFQFGGCGYFSDKTNQNVANNNSATKESNPNTAEDNGKKAESENLKNEITNLKINLDKAVRELVPDYDSNTPIGQKALNRTDKDCSSGAKKKECESYLKSRNSLLDKINEFCNLDPQKCKTELASESTPINRINEYCQSDAKQNNPKCGEFTNVTAGLDAKIKELELAQQKVSANTNSSASGNTGSNTVKRDETDSLDLGTLLLYAGGGIVGLALLGGIGWLGYSIFNGAFDKERKINDQNFRKASSHAHSLDKKIKALEDTVKLQSGQFTQMQTAIKSLQRQMSDFSGQSFQEEIFAPPVKQPEPKFPVLAEDYLEKNSANAQTATADLIGGLLINDLSKGNEFLIVEDNELEDGLSYAVPNQPRFNTKAEYFNYFQTYYKFENPSSGAIWIKIPALVRRTEGGWKLVQPGNLEVR